MSVPVCWFSTVYLHTIGCLYLGCSFFFHFRPEFQTGRPQFRLVKVGSLFFQIVILRQGFIQLRGKAGIRSLGLLQLCLYISYPLFHFLHPAVVCPVEVGKDTGLLGFQFLHILCQSRYALAEPAVLADL